MLTYLRLGATNRRLSDIALSVRDPRLEDQQDAILFALLVGAVLWPFLVWAVSRSALVGAASVVAGAVMLVTDPGLYAVVGLPVSLFGVAALASRG
jgi:hypothetical protein